ncbi:hypothetical protein BDQ12DRAFT_494990 [Crucibulum laeve]|uniref:3-carboxymuconate cyclase n=1 Tax=Crucibulum laeve TaxID=68775 RepID=A0A5C3M6U8_9AGAR|nr:hypothetical protein BDQ12DRAFT_494990 [Crucibulum laeve]
MKLSINSIVLSIFLASFATAGPVSRGQPIANGSSKQMAPARGQTAGAAYFITNEPSGNFLITAEIGTNGQLTLRRAIDAGGIGAHGIVSPVGPDPLFSQGSVKASAAGNIVATVNSGSNTLAVFSIDPNDSTSVSMIGKPVGSGGQFPMSLAINKAGDSVCALNGGEVNGVSCFKVDKQSGLVPISNTVRSLGLNQTTPATGPAGSASHIIFSEDNTQLIASVKGVPPQPGFLAVWDIASDGSLSADFQSIAPQKGGLLPFSMTVIAGKNAILATDAGLGFDIFDFNANRNGNASTNTNNTSSSGDRSSANAIAGQSATCWSSFSPKTGNFFLTDVGTATITEVNVDNNLKGTIVKQYPQANGSATIDNDIATVAGKDFLYVLAPGATSIDVLSLDGPGKARNIQKVDIAGPAKSVGLTINANNLQGMTTFVKN